MTLTCLCGRLRATIAKRPDYINECNCTLCAKSGAQWGYFDPAEVRIEGVASGYERDDKEVASARLQFCATCGSTTHFVLTESAIAKFGNGVMGVNMRLADEQELTGIELRYPDGKVWPGHGDVHYVRPTRIIGEPQG